MGDPINGSAHVRASPYPLNLVALFLFWKVAGRGWLSEMVQAGPLRKRCLDEASLAKKTGDGFFTSPTPHWILALLRRKVSDILSASAYKDMAILSVDSRALNKLNHFPPNGVSLD